MGGGCGALWKVIRHYEHTSCSLRKNVYDGVNILSSSECHESCPFCNFMQVTSFVTELKCPQPLFLNIDKT